MCPQLAPEKAGKEGFVCLFVCFLAETVGKARARRPVKGTWSMKATEPSSPSFFSYVFSIFVMMKVLETC